MTNSAYAIQRTPAPAQPAQAITPQLRQWIAQRLEVAHGDIYQEMVKNNWSSELALQALYTTLADIPPLMNLRKGLPVMTGMRRIESPSPSALAPVNAPVPAPGSLAKVMPHASIEDAPLYLDAGDIRVSVLQTMTEPNIVVFGGLLSDAECEVLIEAARPRMARSMTVVNQTGGEEVHADRTSRGMFFKIAENTVVAKLEARIAKLVNWPLERGEALQVLHYQPGAEYKPHYDYFDPKEPGSATLLKRGGQRVGTVLVYLGEPAKGGGTVFPDVRLTVAPKRGNAVFFSYDRPDPSTLTLHGGAPVLAGEKWVATKWLREGTFI